MNPFVGQTKNTRIQHKPLEKQVVWKIWDYLKQLPDSWWLKVHGSAYQAAGVPDIIGCYRGRFVSFEVKRNKKGYSATPKQLDVMRRINAAKGEAHVIYNGGDAQKIIEAIDEVLPPRV